MTAFPTAAPDEPATAACTPGAVSTSVKWSGMPRRYARPRRSERRVVTGCPSARGFGPGGEPAGNGSSSARSCCTQTTWSCSPWRRRSGRFRTSSVAGPRPTWRSSGRSRHNLATVSRVTQSCLLREAHCAAIGNWQLAAGSNWTDRRRETGVGRRETGGGRGRPEARDGSRCVTDLRSMCQYGGTEKGGGPTVNSRLHRTPEVVGS